jgi:hypothetical protein
MSSAQGWLSDQHMTRLDPPRTLQARWEAENAVDQGPDERQVMDWNEHNARADGLTADYDLDREP